VNRRAPYGPDRSTTARPSWSAGRDLIVVHCIAKRHRAGGLEHRPAIQIAREVVARLIE
jgi:hypothetical protein